MIYHLSMLFEKIIFVHKLWTPVFRKIRIREIRIRKIRRIQYTDTDMQKV